MLKLPKKWRKRGLFFYFFLTGWGAFWVLTWILLISGNSKLLGQTVFIPDFDQLTFSNLPPIANSNSVFLGSTINRSWQEGESASEILTIGDFDGSFNLQNLSLSEIAQLSGQSLEGIQLSQLGLVNDWTIGDMVISLPETSSLTIQEVPLIQDVIQANGYNPQAFSSLTLQELNQIPDIPNLKLSSVNLNNYSLTALPELTDVPLKNLIGWPKTTIAEIPFLEQVSFSNFPSPPNLNPAVGIGQIDLVLGTAEHPTYQSISGSYQVGFEKNCTANCAHIELGGTPLVAGRQWIYGGQKVSGGFGVLKSMFGCVEPTGRHPFVSGFKLVLWNLDETTDTVETAMFFRLCIRRPIDLGCSPYGIGPVPFLTFYRDDWIPL
jgi:hypothetical protein